VTRLILLAFVIGMTAGVTAFTLPWLLAVSAYKDRLNECGYIPHAMSDVAWELHRRNAIPAATAAYWSHMVNSRNDQKHLENCMSRESQAQ